MGGGGGGGGAEFKDIDFQVLEVIIHLSSQEVFLEQLLCTGG